ncbi:MAG TPA: hypothetical protein VF766_01640 [Pyrinomonadaceae bacterium]
MREKWIEIVMRLSSVRAISLATSILLLLFLLLALFRAYPFVDNVNAATSTGDDWLLYKQYAASILHDGLLIRAHPGTYYEPAGFFYNYFIAAVFWLTGENSSYVYLVQAGMLAISVGLMTIAFKPYLSKQVIPFYWGALALTLFLDMFLIYTFRLLSENLLLFLLPIFFLSILRTFEMKSVLLAACAGIVLGFCSLCRPNIVLIGPTAFILLFIYLKHQPRRGAIISAFLFCFLLVISLLPLRNYLVAHEVRVPIDPYKSHNMRKALGIYQPVTPPPASTVALHAIKLYARLILFCSGLTFLELPLRWLRPHWTLMWAGTFLFAWRAFKRRRLEFWESLTLSFVILYLAPLIVLINITSYGFRMVVPVIPVILLLAVEAFASRLLPAEQSLNPASH